MCHKRYGVRKPLLWYAVAKIGPYALVPPIVVGVLLPAGLLLARTGGNPLVSRVYIDFSMTLLAPSLAVWWPPFVFKERIEGEGRELLYFLKRTGEGATALALALSYWVLLVPFLVVALGTPDFSSASVPLLLARCLFVTSFAFCAAFVLRSSALALILSLLFNMVAMVPLESLAELLAPTIGLDTGSGMSVSTILLYVALSAALLWFGEVRGRQFAE